MSTHPNKRDIHAKALELSKKRRECNQAILNKLADYLRNNPGMRFNQALRNLNIIVTFEDILYDEDGEEYQGASLSDYCTEPSEVLKRMK